MTVVLDAPPQTISAAVPARKLNALTSLRFIAAVMIVIHHSAGQFGFPSRIAPPFVLDHAVAFFFVLSGFVLTHVYPTLDRRSARRFLLARFARIWPAHVVTLILAIVLLPVWARSTDGSQTLGEFVANLGMTHGWIPLSRYYFAFNGVSWSISTEFGFYLCFMLLILGWRRNWAVKLVLTLLLAVAMVWLGNKLPHLEAGLVYINPVARVFEFTLGMTAALAWRALDGQLRVTRTVGSVIELGAIAFAVTCMYFTEYWAAASVPWVGNAGGAWLVHGGISCVSFAVLIVVMALERGVVSRGLSLPLAVLLGEISYSVYLFHQIILRYFIVHPSLMLLPPWLAYAMVWILILLLSHLCWRLIECPARAYLTTTVPAAIDRWRGTNTVDGPKRPRPSTAPRSGMHSLPAEIASAAVLVVLIGYWAYFHPSTIFVDRAEAERIRSGSLKQAMGCPVWEPVAAAGC